MNYKQKSIIKLPEEIQQRIYNDIKEYGEVLISGIVKISVVERKGRKIYSPIVGKVVDQPTRKAPKFKPSTTFKRFVRNLK